MRRKRRDAGFTLPEMMITITVMALLASIIATTVSVTLRNLPATSARADSAVLVQGLTTWLPPDVDSTTPDEFYEDPAETSGCSGTDPGINLLTLRWNETYRGTSTDYTASYRFVDDGDRAHVERIYCEDNGSPSVLTMTGPLSTIPPVVTVDPYDPASTEDNYVVVRLQTLAGEQITIEAATKDPDDSLPYAPPPPPAVPPNTAPYAGYWTVNVEETTSVPLPGPARTFTFPAGDTDGDPTVINTVAATVPPELNVVVTGTEFTVEANATAVVGNTYSFDFEVFDPALLWDSGTIEVEVVAPGAAYPPGPPEYSPPPCIVTPPSVIPNPVRLKNSNPGKLRKDVEVTINVLSGYCVGLHLVYDTGGPNGEVVQNFGNAAPYTISLLGHPHGAELWTAGPHLLRVMDGNGTLLTQTTLTVTS